MMRFMHKRMLLAALALLCALALAACNRVDTRDDPLSAYENDATAPAATPTAPPAAAPTVGATVSSYTFSRLEFGDEGEEVLRLQNRLIELGYMQPGTADSKYGESTKTAVKAFQGALGLSKTGIANINLQQKLFLSTAPSYVEPTPTPPPVYATSPAATQPPSGNTGNTDNTGGSGGNTGFTELSRGSYGDEVKALQRRLIALGYLTGEADGSFGAQTANAVKRFQAAIGVTQTGVATAYIQEVLFSSGAPSRATAAPTAARTPAPTPRPTTNVTPNPTEPREYATLRKGNYNTAVYNMQKRLRELGYMEGRADGDYGQLTVDAVKLFLQAIGQDGDGTSATGYVQQRLYASDAPAYAKPTPTPGRTYRELQPDDTGDDVKRLQARLRDLGYFDGEVGGNYLTKTTAAVKKFQAAAGFDVNGVATVELQEFLFSSEAPAAAATSAPVKATPTPKPSSTPFHYVELAYGDTGNRVKTLQSRLKELGYFDGNVAGNYLDQTRVAVKRFQATVGLDVTGVATVEMQELLFASDAPTYNGISPTPKPTSSQSETQYVQLSYGDTGNRVKKIQSRLKELGFFDGNVAGNYLEKTQAAVKAFQQAAGLTANGVATVETQERLFADNAPTKGSGGSGQTGQYTSLGPGSTGNAVKKLQSRLIELGYMNGPADGDYGALTIAAVKMFQVAIGQSTTGSATGYLQEKLYASDAPTYAEAGAVRPGSYAQLSFGDQGDEVKNLQKRLYLLGFYRYGEDWDEDREGVYDEATRRAVRDFQLACGYGEDAADGTATVDLQELLFSEDALIYSQMDVP